MGIPKAAATGVFTDLSLELESERGLGFGESHVLWLPSKIAITARVTFEGGSFTEPPNRDVYEKVDFSLDSVGTHHRCLSIDSLRSNGERIIQALMELAAKPELLKCPKCKVRPVHLKEPYPGAKWKPFLSCAGMVIVGRGRDKRPACDGVLRSIPALITYR